MVNRLHELNRLDILKVFVIIRVGAAVSVSFRLTRDKVWHGLSRWRGTSFSDTRLAMRFGSSRWRRLGLFILPGLLCRSRSGCILMNVASICFNVTAYMAINGNSTATSIVLR